MSPILDLQRRLVQVGRIRLGEKKKGQNYPSKLSKFRITSKDRQRLEAIAHLYGGKVQAWEGHEGEFEIYTDTDALDVAVVPGQAFSQDMEVWGQEHAKSHKGPNPVICLRRCDTQSCMVPNPKGKGWSEVSCLCADEDEPLCKPTSRLAVVLTKIPGFGVWRLDSKGWNAAAELAGSVQLLEAMIASNRPVRARLSVEIVTETKRAGTFKYPKPRLDIDHTLDEVLTITSGGNGHALTGSPTTAELGGGPSFTPVPELPAGPGSSIAEQVGAVNDPQPKSQRSNAAEPLKPTGRAPRKASEVSATPVSQESTDDAAGGGDSGSQAPSDGPPGSESTPSSTEGGGMQRPQVVAMWCKDAGITDEETRHAFLEAFSRVLDPDHVYRSSKDLPHEHLDHLKKALARVKAGELELVVDPEGKNAPHLVDTKTGEIVVKPGMPAPPVTDGGWDEARWRENLKNVPGVGPVKLLKEARKVAGELGVALPSGLDEISDEQLVIRMLTWLREQKAAA